MCPVFVLPVCSPSDVEEVRRQTRQFMVALAATVTERESVVLAVSELATNLLRYAVRGSIRLSSVADHAHRGVRVESRDDGPGIADIAQALQDGWSTSGGMGSGLPAVRRLMDTLTIRTDFEGTVIVAYKGLNY